MPKINGFEMLELIEEPRPVIFTTAFDDMPYKLLNMQGCSLILLKPFSKERFDKAIQKYVTTEKKDCIRKNRSCTGSAAQSPGTAKPALW
jgi:two-component system LytT family response regulator